MLKNSRKCLTNGSKVCKIARVLSKQHKNEWDLSSAGRASALQAEGHRFEPYRSHFYGGIAQLARAHGSYPWCREFKSPFRYEFRSSGFPELLFLFHRKLRPMKQKALRWDAHSAQRWMVAKATAPRRENVPRHILFYIACRNSAVAYPLIDACNT